MAEVYAIEIAKRDGRALVRRGEVLPAVNDLEGQRQIPRGVAMAFSRFAANGERLTMPGNG